MKTRRLIFTVILVVLTIVIFSALIPQVASANAQQCGMPGTPPCSTSGRADRPQGQAAPETPAPKATATQATSLSATSASIPLTGNGSGSQGSNMPAVQNPGQGSKPMNESGSLGKIIAMLISIATFGGFIIVVRRFLNGGTEQAVINQTGDESSQFEKYGMDSDPNASPAGGQFDDPYEPQPPGATDEAGDQSSKLDG